MLHLGQSLHKRKRATTIAIAAGVAAAVSLAAFGLTSNPASFASVNNAFSAVFDWTSRVFVMLSEAANSVVASIQNMLGQQ